jgi:dTDP-4-dehydrorhamnose reductase
MTAPLLVVGRRGQLATDLVAAGDRLSVPLVALGRPELDLLDEASLAAAIERVAPRAVINAAAYTAVDRAEAEPDLAFALNRDGPARLAALCARAGLPLVHVSTDQVFDGRRDGGHVEEDEPNPLCIYGRSKLEGERAVAAAGGSHLIVRVSWVFGPSADNFVKKVLAWASARDTLSIVSDQRGRPTYSPALAEALIDLAGRMAADGPPRPAGLLHLAGASVMTRVEQAREVLAGSRLRGGPSAEVVPVLTKDFPTPAPRPLNAELDVTRAARLYDIQMRPFAEDLAETLDRIIGPPRGRTS